MHRRSPIAGAGDRWGTSAGSQGPTPRSFAKVGAGAEGVFDAFSSEQEGVPARTEDSAHVW